MTVILVALVTFLVLVVLYYALNRRKGVRAAPALAPKALAAMPGGDYVNGFKVPPGISYHSGHTWLVTATS